MPTVLKAYLEAISLQNPALRSKPNFVHLRGDGQVV